MMMAVIADGSMQPDTKTADRHDVVALERCLHEVGERVRSLRLRRGMTRRLLSAHAGVSERYLSQVENGQANLSLRLLLNISNALDTDLRELMPSRRASCDLPGDLEQSLASLGDDQLALVADWVRDRFDSAGGPQHGLALVGLRGAGKSTIGAELSAATGIPHVDLTDIIQQISGMQIAELIALGGQSAYRRFESSALDAVMDAWPIAILETGGSLVTRYQTYQRLLRHYRTVWVRASPQEHMDRVRAQGDLRPMRGHADAMQDLKRMLAEREHEYAMAHHVLDTSARGVDECVDEVLQIAARHRIADSPRSNQMDGMIS